jgi:DNA-directed RNA polymerase omega subunit
MAETDRGMIGAIGYVGDEGLWPGIDSRFRLVIVAALRSKQLLRGAHPRISSDPKKRRNTSIALEEVKQGLVAFVNDTKEAPAEGGDADAAGGGS